MNCSLAMSGGKSVNWYPQSLGFMIVVVDASTDDAVRRYLSLYG